MDLERSEVVDWRGGVIKVPAAGVYDPEKQLASEQIIEMKIKLRTNPDLFVKVCGHLTLTLIGSYYEYSNEVLSEEEERKNFEDQIKYSAATGASIARLLEEALASDDSEWPEYLTPPATFAEAIKELETTQQVRGGASG